LGGSLPPGATWAGASAPREFLSRPDAEPVIAMALTAAHEAMAEAGLSNISERSGCVIGTSKPGLRSFAKLMKQAGGPGCDFWPNAAARAIASEWNLFGPALCPVAACATGLVSLIRGADLIRSRECDVVLAGSSDASLVPIVLGSFQRLGVMARGFEEASSACRPFDAERSGFVIGEGAAVLVLEDRERAIARGAAVIAEFVAGGMASDPSGLTQVDPAGTSLAWLIRDVLRRAIVSPSEIDAINLHGTATRTNDVAETHAVRAALGTAAPSDPQCDLDYVPNVARRRPLRNVLKLSLGFGGHLAVGLFRSAHADYQA
ncbi:MAG: beta-ketoacyl-acyl-carrier-protein synthase I, partial [Planctomycetota bacterium]